MIPLFWLFWHFLVNSGHFCHFGATWWPRNTILSSIRLNNLVVPHRENSTVLGNFVGFRSPLYPFHSRRSHLATHWHNLKPCNHQLWIFKLRSNIVSYMAHIVEDFLENQIIAELTVWYISPCQRAPCSKALDVIGFSWFTYVLPYRFLFRQNLYYPTTYVRN